MRNPPAGALIERAQTVPQAFPAMQARKRPGEHPPPGTQPRRASVSCPPPSGSAARKTTRRCSLDLGSCSTNARGDDWPRRAEDWAPYGSTAIERAGIRAGKGVGRQAQRDLWRAGTASGPAPLKAPA